jgi:hypothetical protein
LEKHVVNILASVDGDDFSSDEEDSSFSQGQVNPTRFRAKVVRIAKGEFGLLQRTKANQLMVQKFMRDYMRDHGVRPTHIGLHLPYCVHIFFVPSRQEIEAHQLNAAREVHERENMMGEVWESFYGPLGRMLGFRKE